MQRCPSIFILRILVIGTFNVTSSKSPHKSQKVLEISKSPKKSQNASKSHKKYLISRSSTDSLIFSLVMSNCLSDTKRRGNIRADWQMIVFYLVLCGFPCIHNKQKPNYLLRVHGLSSFHAYLLVSSVCLWRRVESLLCQSQCTNFKTKLTE